MSKYTFDSYGLTQECGCCLDGEFKKMRKAGIDPKSVDAVRLVFDSLRGMDNDKAMHLAGQYALAAIFAPEEVDDEST